MMDDNGCVQQAAPEVSRLEGWGVGRKGPCGQLPGGVVVVIYRYCGRGGGVYASGKPGLDGARVSDGLRLW